MRGKNGEVKLNLYFNPMDEQFQLARGKGKPDGNWFKVSDVLQAEVVSDILDTMQLGDAERKTITRMLEKLRDSFRNYRIPVVHVEMEWDKYKDDFIKVFEKWSEMFTRLNSSGTKVKLHDLVLALITGRTVAGRTEPFRERFS